MHIVYFYIRLYSFYGPCGPEIKLYYYYYYLRPWPIVEGRITLTLAAILNCAYRLYIGVLSDGHSTSASPFIG